MPTFSHTKLVGTSYRGADAKLLVAQLAKGDTVELELEPDNEYDSNAIKVMIGDCHVGYIDRDVAAYLAPYLEEDDITVTATVVDFLPNPNGKVTYPLLDIEVGPAGSALAGLSDPLDEKLGKDY